MRSHIVTALVAALVAIGAMLLAEPDGLSQQAFPCAEDEVLSYAPQFGTDRVGCLHIEEI
jgi:hypothetical protein